MMMRFINFLSRKKQSKNQSNKTLFILVVLIIVAFFLNFYKSDAIPGCVNADEAAFGYNAFSILETGKDEHGTFLPLRLASFNDFKLPLYAYLSMPFIKLFGLSEFSIRILNKLLAIMSIPLMYLFVKELFKNKHIALLSASVLACSPWIYLISRQAHEALLCTFFVILAFLFVLKFFEKESSAHLVLANIFILLASFSYHTGRLYVAIFFLLQMKWLWDQFKSSNIRHIKLKKWLIFMCVIAGLSFSVDFLYGPTRVQNLLFNKTSGFQLKIDEFLREDSNRLIHNKSVASIIDVSQRYISQISPEYLIKTGDDNLRFGFMDISLITPFQYALVFVGIYFLYRRKEKHKIFLAGLLLLTPLTNAFTWQMPSLSRTFFLIVPITTISCYGLYWLLKELNGKSQKVLIMTGIFIFHILFLIFSWDVYFNHYFKRSLTIQAWQCGYRELTEYVKKEYSTKKRFLITKKHGQPYIFFLFYWKYPPEKYQNSAKITPPDEYGLSQVKEFDKMGFEGFSSDQIDHETTVIGYPDDFNDAKIDEKELKKIIINNQEIFWIY